MAFEQPGSARGRAGQDPFIERVAQHDRVQVRDRRGIWEVKVDGKFRGDYRQKEHALAAVPKLKLSLR